MFLLKARYDDRGWRGRSQAVFTLKSSHNLFEVEQAWSRQYEILRYGVALLIYSYLLVAE
jgi:hypothetical protein